MPIPTITSAQRDKVYGLFLTAHLSLRDARDVLNLDLEARQSIAYAIEKINTAAYLLGQQPLEGEVK